jgi:putative transposase
MIVVLAWSMTRRQAMMRLVDATLVVNAEIGNVAAWCRANGVNERTFYRHRKRIEAEGEWRPRSRRPKSSPNATPAGIVEQIVRLRDELAPDNGADNIRAVLETLAHAQDWATRGWRVPARATINRVLDRHGLLAKNPAKRPRSSWRRFTYARPRDCYQIDGTEYTLADGTICVALDVIDDCSRVWVASHAARAETIDAALEAMSAAITEWGPPGMVLADNGSAFAHRDRAKDKTLTSRFSRTLARDHSIRVIHSSPYHPQTCGKVERLHQSAAKLLDHHYPAPATSITELQHRLDTLRTHYNTRRRHGSLDTTPAAFWQHAPAHGGPGDLPRQDDATIHLIRVTSNGTAALGRRNIFLGRAHADTTITLLRNGRHVTAYHPDGEVLGTLTLDETKRYQGKLTPAA